MSGRHTDMNVHVNKTYNFLTVESIGTEIYTYKNKNIKKTYFNCYCICGNYKKIFANNVVSGSIKSCGCKKKELIKESNDKHYEKNKQLSVEKRMYSDYKLHGKDFDLTFQEFNDMIISNCNYCGSAPNHLRFSKNRKLSKLLNGIDRLDSDKGYNIENCVPCCTTCNYMKNTLSVSTFLEHIKKIKEHNKL